jgi:hypothetical protein
MSMAHDVFCPHAQGPEPMRKKKFKKSPNVQFRHKSVRSKDYENTGEWRGKLESIRRQVSPRADP